MMVSGGPFYWVFIPNQRGDYDAVLSNAAANSVTVATGTMTLERFTAGSAVIRIVSLGHTATATGKAFGATNVVSGNWSNERGDHGTFTATWDPSPDDASGARNGHGSTVVMTECEEGHCGTWKFSRKQYSYWQGIGTSTTGETASLLLTVKGDTVTIKRTDPDTGYEAEYTGTQDRDGLSGKFISSSPVQKSGNWNAIAASRFELPAAMKFCGPYACQDLRLRGSKYESVGPDGNATGSTWTVEQFDLSGVRMVRADPDGYTATLTGKISQTGNSIIGGLQAGNRGGTVPYQMTWGTAYGTAQKTAIAGSLSGRPITTEDITRGVDLITSVVKLVKELSQ